ncbi:FIST signal transduction protein [Candidatus Margulisiibacteriota bacterium]
MSIKMSSGYSATEDAFNAGKEAAQIAFQKLNNEKPDQVLLFTTVGYELEDVLEGIKEVTGDVPISGCSGDGIITQELIDEGLFSISLAFLKAENAKIYNFVETGLKADSFACGKSISEKIKAFPSNEGDNKLLLVFPDSFTANLTQLFKGIETNGSIPIIGGASGDNLKWAKSYQFHNEKVLSDSVSAVYITGSFKFDTLISHGTDETSFENLVTKSDKNNIIELDNKPALDVLSEYYGEPITDDNFGGAAVSLGVGDRIPDDIPISEYDSKYILRTIMGIDSQKKSVMLPAEIKEGDPITIVRRDNEVILNYAKKAADKMAAKIKDSEITGILHFDCAGRGACIFGERAKEEPQIFQQEFGKNIPWCGFYCFTEIAPVGGKNYSHNYTSILLLFYQ